MRYYETESGDFLDYMKREDRAYSARKAALAAIRSHRESTGAFYNGPYTEVYLAVLALLNKATDETTVD